MVGVLPKRIVFFDNYHLHIGGGKSEHTCKRQICMSYVFHFISWIISTGWLSFRTGSWRGEEGVNKWNDRWWGRWAWCSAIHTRCVRNPCCHSTTSEEALTLAAFLGNDKPNTANRNNACAQTPRRKAAQEIDHHRLTSSLDLISDTGVETDPLAWWRDHCHDFPLFACKTYEEVSLYTGIEFAVWAAV